MRKSRHTGRSGWEATWAKAPRSRAARWLTVRARMKPQDFITGFLQDGIVYGRPCDIFRMGADSFLLTDDYSGVIYYIHPK